MNYTRQYENRINWQNTPSVSTPINATNLNKMDNALNYMDGKMAEAARAINNSFVLAGAGRELSYNNSIVDTDIYLHRAPKAGDRLLLKMSSTVTSSPQVKIYDEDGGTAYTLSFAFWGSFMALKGLCLIEVVDDDGLQLVLAYSFNGTEYTAGTGISISNGYINNTMPQLGVNTGYSEVTSVSSGNLGTVDEDAEYFFLNFKTNASPSSGKYTIMLASGMSFKYGLLKDRSGNDFSKNLYSGMVLLCKKESSGTGTEQDPVLITVLSITNWYVEIGRKANTTVGVGTTAEGRDTTASGQYSHAEGMDTVASGNRSHAEGQETTASGGISHAEGLDTTASGDHSHAEGDSTFASGEDSHAEGDHTQAVAAYTHAGGHGTIASYEAMTAIGKYNKSDTYGTLFEIGNGTDGSHRSNAFAVNDSGNAIASGNVSAGGNLTASGHVQDGNGNDLASVAALELTASGNPIIVQAQDVAAKGLKVTLEPIQDLHGYDKPWVGGAGKNKVELLGLGFLDLTTGDIPTGVTSSDYAYTNRFKCSNQPYVVSGSIIYQYLSYYWDIDGNFISYTGGSIVTPFTPPSNAYYTALAVRKNNTVSSIDDFGTVQCEEGSTATSYTPYSNICPISGHTSVVIDDVGRNIWDEQWEVGYWDDNGVKQSNDNCIRSKNYIPIIPNTAYNMTPPPNATVRGVTFRILDANKNVIRSIVSIKTPTVIDVPQNGYYAVFSTAALDAISTYNHDICINVSDPSFNGQYVPYKGRNTETISLGQTVYGGTVNLVTGVDTVTHAIVDMGSLSWLYQNSRFLTDDLTGKKAGITNLISSAYATTDVPGAASMENGTIKGQSDNVRVLVRNDAYTDAALFTTAMTGQKICYELATPIELTLSPAMLELIKGYNYITGDGEMELVYIPESVLGMPAPPTTDGTYRLICTVSNGVPVFSWVSDT